MVPVRVMLVDDSSLVRRLVTQALERHPQIRVVASAPNGLIALRKLEQQEVDVLLLDVEMPEMDGLTMLRQLRLRDTRLPVIMFSTLTERGANTTFDALTAGANDYVLKPSTASGETLDSVVTQSLVPKLLYLGAARAAPDNLRPLVSARAANASAQKLPAIASEPVRVLAIAASTGGPNALADVLAGLPNSLGVPVLIVQHMPPLFTRCLAERLGERSELTVLESEGGELLRPGCVYIAPGQRHLEVTRTNDGVRTVLSDGPPENSCRPAADVMYRSVARVYGSSALCVVLTGMGQDGLRGAREVRAAGGRVLVQSGPTCVVWGMPRAVEEAGLAEAVVPLPELASAIMMRLGSGLIPARTQVPR
jgi:two-component system, chemotaxis family, protein-glutamate methylesterase/glutaminase